MAMELSGGLSSGIIAEKIRKKERGVSGEERRRRKSLLSRKQEESGARRAARSPWSAHRPARKQPGACSSSLQFYFCVPWRILVTFSMHTTEVWCMCFAKKINSDEITSTGTGFIIWSTGNQSLVLTCNHCVNAQHDERLVVRPSGDEVDDLDATLVFGDDRRDIAVIRIANVDREAMRFAEDDDEFPTVGSSVVALSFSNPEKDEDEISDEDESQDGSEVSDKYQDNIFVYPDEPESCPGEIISPRWHDEFSEVFEADCGLISSGGPLVFQNMVVGVAIQVGNQVEKYATAATVKDVFQDVLSLDRDDLQTMDELISMVAEM